MKRALLLTAAVVFTIPIAVTAQKVKVFHDNGVDFARFKTYSWIKGKPAPNPQSDRLITANIEKQLQSRGLQRVDQNADLNLAYYVSLDDKFNTTTINYMQGLDWARWGGGGQTYAEVAVMPMASMLVDLVDVSANKLVWRGTAKDTFTANQARRKKRITTALEKMFKEFPPHAR